MHVLPGVGNLLAAGNFPLAVSNLPRVCCSCFSELYCPQRLRAAAPQLRAMDFKGQKLAEQLCLYIILAAGALAFVTGWYQGSFAAMMKASIQQSFIVHNAGQARWAQPSRYRHALIWPVVIQAAPHRLRVGRSCAATPSGRRSFKTLLSRLAFPAGLRRRCGRGDAGVRARLAVFQHSPGELAAQPEGRPEGSGRHQVGSGQVIGLAAAGRERGSRWGRLESCCCCLLQGTGAVGGRRAGARAQSAARDHLRVPKSRQQGSPGFVLFSCAVACGVCQGNEVLSTVQNPG